MTTKLASTYKEFGDRADCDYTMVSRILSGDRAPSTRLLARICMAFDIDHGEALRRLAADQTKSDRTVDFANWLREQTMADAVSERT